MIKDIQTQEEISYEQFGITRRGVRADAPRFRIDPMTHRDARLGEDIVTNPANIGPGTVLRGSLAPRAKATPMMLHLSHALPYQVSTPITQSAINMIVSLAGPAGGNPNHIDGWQLYGEFPIRDRLSTHNSALTPRGIAIDSNFVWVAQAARLWRMPHDFSSIIEITPSGSTIPSINGLASNGTDLFTTNGGTAFYRIVVSDTTYTWTTQATLAFPIAKIGCFTGNYFIGHDSTNSLLRQWRIDGTLWRNIPYREPNFMGTLMLNGFVYVVIQLGSLPIVQLTPARI